jgi:thiamine pyridinylase
VPTVKQWLLTQEEDVVEIDTLLLGDLVNAGVIAPFEKHVSSDWHSAAAAAVQFNQAVYAIPHWLCVYFLFTRDPYVAQSKTINELVERLGAGVFRRLVGNLDASWDLPALYMDTYQDQTYSPLYSLQAGFIRELPRILSYNVA